ncbi:MAG: hypothetical protein ACM3NQ_01320 [Bacteroidales bacterium]
MADHDDPELLTVANFERLMHYRDKMHEAQFGEVKAIVVSGFEKQESLHSQTQELQRKTNGRLTIAEQKIDAIQTGGCAQLRTHREMLTEETPRAWHERPVVRGVGGGAMFVALLELLRELITKTW